MTSWLWDIHKMPPRHRKTRNSKRQQQRRQQLLKQRGSVCESCGFEGYVEMHHIIRAVDGGTFDDDNLVMLCVPCHKQADREARGRANGR